MATRHKHLQSMTLPPSVVCMQHKPHRHIHLLLKSLFSLEPLKSHHVIFTFYAQFTPIFSLRSSGAQMLLTLAEDSYFVLEGVALHGGF